jgi:hypothetical protein
VTRFAMDHLPLCQHCREEASTGLIRVKELIVLWLGPFSRSESDREAVPCPHWSDARSVVIINQSHKAFKILPILDPSYFRLSDLTHEQHMTCPHAGAPDEATPGHHLPYHLFGTLIDYCQEVTERSRGTQTARVTEPWR